MTATPPKTDIGTSIFPEVRTVINRLNFIDFFFFSMLLSCMRGCFGQSEFHVPSIRAENIRKCSQLHQCHVHDAFWAAALMQKKGRGKQTVYEPWMYKCKSHPISIMYKHEMVSKSRRLTVYAY